MDYSIFICSFESGKCGKEGKKITNKWTSGEQKLTF